MSIIVVGNDTLVEALPALPVQVAHACLAAGYDHVLPLSWGDELVAEAALRTLEQRVGQPAVLCACPFVRQRLLGTGADLAPLIVDLPSPAVALARFVRAAFAGRLGTLDFVGRCPSARRGAYDRSFEPRELLEQLRARGIDVNAQPEMFEGVLPPDRRRFASLPGGCPSAEALWSRSRERLLVELDEPDLPIELAERLLERRAVLVDVAPGLGCACSGVTPTTPARSARIAVRSLEPPRASAPVIDTSAAVLDIILGSGESGGPEPPGGPMRERPDGGGGSGHSAEPRPGAPPLGDAAPARDPSAPAPGAPPPRRRAPLAITPSTALTPVSPRPPRASAGPRSGRQDASNSSRARVMAAVSHSSGE